MTRYRPSQDSDAGTPLWVRLLLVVIAFACMAAGAEFNIWKYELTGLRADLAWVAAVLGTYAAGVLIARMP